MMNSEKKEMYMQVKWVMDIFGKFYWEIVYIIYKFIFFKIYENTRIKIALKLKDMD